MEPNGLAGEIPLTEEVSTLTSSALALKNSVDVLSRSRKQFIWCLVIGLVIILACIATVIGVVINGQDQSKDRGQDIKSVVGQIGDCTTVGGVCYDKLRVNSRIDTARGIAAVVDCYNKSNFKVDNVFQACLEVELNGSD